MIMITFPFFRQYEMKIRDSELRRHNKALSHCLLTLRLSLHLKETSLHSCSKHSFKYLFGCLWYFLLYFFLILLYSTVLVLPYINMKLLRSERLLSNDLRWAIPGIATQVVGPVLEVTASRGIHWNSWSIQTFKSCLYDIGSVVTSWANVTQTKILPIHI